MRRRSTIAAGLAVAACLLAAGCGSSDDDGATSASTSGGGEPTGTLRIVAWDTGAPNDPLDAAARAFEQANRGVRVEIRKTPFVQYEQGLRMQLNAGQTPDIARTVLGYGGPVTALTLADKGLLSDLADQPWAGEMPQNVRFTTDVGDATYAYPIDTAALGLLYDPAVIGRAGVAVPTTFDEVLEVCRRAAGADQVAFALGAAQGSGMPAWVAMSFAASTAYAEDPDFGQQRLDDEVTFAGNEGWQTGMAQYEQMNAAGCFGEDAVGTSQEAASAALAQGRALFAVVANVALPLFQGANPRARLELAPFAGNRDAELTRVAASPVAGLVVPGKAQNPELAKAFLDFYYENRIAYSELDSSIPAIPERAGDVRLPAYAAALKPYFDGDRTVVVADAQWPNPEVKVQFDTGLVQMLLGDSSGEDVLESMDAVWTSTPSK